MSDAMPERVYAGCSLHGNSWGVPNSVLVERLDNATEYIRADVAAAQRWVSVDERLPEPFVMSLFVNANLAREPRCGYVNRRGKLKNPDGTAVHRGPTHWMPLPPSPVTADTP